ncbi:polysaccharide deacetylase family protein [Fodinicola feengrottensis]|uniref:hypothetical protein n=1 Tax=Fodinicola feengrottensis TaxID=435914 RepID=UPI0013D5F72D|nr:hypothetical protein [Fodinicola feengrottensis]
MTQVDGKELPTEDVAARIEELLVRLDSATDPTVRATAEELVRTLIQFYGSGLERIMELVFEDDVVAESVVPKFVGDKLVGSILVLHDLHPSTTEERVVEALERGYARTWVRILAVSSCWGWTRRPALFSCGWRAVATAARLPRSP